MQIERSPTFKQVAVDAILGSDVDGTLRITVGTLVPSGTENKPRPMARYECELVIGARMVEDLQRQLARWQKAHGKKEKKRTK